MTDSAKKPRTWYEHYHHTPLYVRILAGMVLGVVVGLVLSGVYGRFKRAEVRAELLDVLKAIAPDHDFSTLDDRQPLVQQVPLGQAGVRGVIELHARYGLEVPVEDDPQLETIASAVRYLTPRLKDKPGHGAAWAHTTAESFERISKLVLRVLEALASPLILLAVMRALIHAEFPPGSGLKLASLLVLNTIVAIMIGLLVANVLQPGRWGGAKESAGTETESVEKIKNIQKSNPIDLILENVPKSILGPFGDGGSVIAVIMISVAFGIALRKMKGDATADQAIKLLEVGFSLLLQLLHWIVDVIPLAVFGIVASILGKGGLYQFLNLGGFIIAVLVALALQMVYYLTRIKFGCWAKPLDVLRGMRDALVMAFTTGSSTATMPVTYACLREKVGLRERSASLGSLVGANFNNDGTALYEAMAALFVSQMMVGLGLAKDLTFMQQVLVVITSVFASVGAAGIPEAGLVTMTLVFGAVGLDTKYIAMLLPVDWFLDRCRTAVNVMGDVNVSCMLEGKQREAVHAEPAAKELRELTDDSPPEAAPEPKT